MNQTHKHTRPGFNFIEMMVSLLIIGIIMGLVGGPIFKLLGRGRKTATISNGKIVLQGIKQFKMDTGSYPNTLEELNRKPENASSWDGPYAVKSEESGTNELPVDGWDQPYMYKKNQQGAVPPYELYSNGDPDKEDDKIEIK